MNTVLITGGTGKTGKRIAEKLTLQGVSVRVASRSALPINDYESIRFIWGDETTYDAALKDVKAIYLLAPANVAEPLDVMKPFIDYAVKKGVKRFVLLSASSLPKGGPMMGAVHAYLEETVPEWAALRPTWFMQNFSEQQHLETILSEGAIYSATDNGRVPFIDADDIASVAAVALTQKEPLNRDVIMTGPSAITYDDVASMISRVINKPVEHIKLTEGQLRQRFIISGMELVYANVLSAMDTSISLGSEENCSNEVKKLTGKDPISFLDFAEQATMNWIR
ncbi:ergot alkaloid biosynthesis protein [Agarivorans sp. Toyoura001]|uniref:ergot alkaloid biosynthesis protein n=1 Tax=unclassified Agarivorans TaxID=2636026 RepID=UPI0010EE4A36|nr:ergot alkaloid biosynthesis protein [Agarivorans sp. Toyoura001]GDY25427.1 oxidoreductase [Agarivorans sp. Toyoura001]